MPPLCDDTAVTATFRVVDLARDDARDHEGRRERAQ